MNILIAEFQTLGCSPIEAALSVQVYLELTEVKKYYDVSYTFNEPLNKMCLYGRKIQSSPLMCFIPVNSNEELNFKKLEHYASIAGDTIKKVYLVICTNDATNVYYEIATGIGDPQLETAKHSIEKQREAHDRVLNKNISALKESAMHNIPITITANQLRKGPSTSSSKK